MTSRAVFDIETNGFLFEFDTIHCVCIQDLETLAITLYPPERVDEGLEVLSGYEMLIGHNICGFDIPAILKLKPDFRYNTLRDSLCMSKLFNPARVGHSLEDYGVQCGVPKVQNSQWDLYTELMGKRCIDDVKINTWAYKHLVDKYCRSWDWVMALEIEQEFAFYKAYQELEGVDVDEVHARDTIRRLDEELLILTERLQKQMPKKYKLVGNSEGNKPFKKDGTYTVATAKWFE